MNERDGALKRFPRPIVPWRLNDPDHGQYNEDEKQPADASRGIIAPSGAVWPSRQGTDDQHNEDNQKKKSHGFGPSSAQSERIGHTTRAKGKMFLVLDIKSTKAAILSRRRREGPRNLLGRLALASLCKFLKDDGMDGVLAPQRLDAFTAMAWTWGTEFLPRIATAAIIVILGTYVAAWAARLALGVAERSGRFDRTLEPIVGSSIRYAVLIIFLVAALSQMGVQTASLLAVLGAAGLAIGLALQGTLSNIAAGIMLLWLRPFRIGDYIEVITGNPIAGTVKEIGLFACLIESYDGPVVFAPNAAIWNFPLRNHNRNGGRLVSLSVGLSEKADLERARQILLDMMTSDGRVLKQPGPDVFVDHLEGGNFSLTCRLWTSPASVGDVQRSMIAQAKRRLEDAAVDSLTPQHIARVVPPDSDPSRLMDGAPGRSNARA
jgi:small conductance mechanosensitive channel